MGGHTGATYDVSPDGRRFLMIEPATDPASATVVHVIVNWFEEQKAKVPPR